MKAKLILLVWAMVLLALGAVNVAVGSVARAQGADPADAETPGVAGEHRFASQNGAPLEALSSQYACEVGSWQTIASLDVPRSRTAVVYSEATGRFYVLGGEATGADRDLVIEEYDAAGDVWTPKSHLFTGVSNTGAAAVGDYIYVPGGFNGSSGLDLMQRYDPISDTVTLMAPMPGVNYAHGVTALDGKVYVLGGSASGVAGTTHFIYDVAANSWITGTAAPTAVQYAAATTDGQYIYLLGGNTADLATVQRYDPASDTWQAAPDLNIGRGGPAAFYDGHTLWAVGGSWSSYLASTEYWDGVSWQPGPEMNAGARTAGAAYGAGMALKAGGWSGVFLAAAETLQIDCRQPNIESSASAITGAQPPGVTVTHTLTISNSGEAPLTWSASEAPAPDAPLLEVGAGGLITYSERALFDAQNPGLPLEDFEDGHVLAGGAVSCPSPLDASSSNICFDEGALLPGILFRTGTLTSTNGLALAGAGWVGSPTVSLATNFLADHLEIHFTAPDVNAVGLDLYSFVSAGDVELTVYGWDGITALGTAMVTTDAAGVFWGVTAQQPIGRLVIRSEVGHEGVDNIAFGYTGACATAQALPWASVSPENGVLAAGEAQELVVGLDSTGLEAGQSVAGTLCISSDDPDEPRVAVGLSLTVEPLQVYLPAFLKP